MKPATTSDRPGFVSPLTVAAEFASRATNFYPELADGPVTCDVHDVIDQPDARLLRAQLGGNGVTHDLIIKLRSTHPSTVLPTDDPWLRLCPFPPEDDLGIWESAGLSSIHQHFADDDPSFRPVRLLEFSKDWNGLIMEFHAGERLDQQLVAAHRFRSGTAAASNHLACLRAGAWLRRFHEMPGTPLGPRLRADRSSIVQHFKNVLAYLDDAAGALSLPPHCAAKLVELAVTHLPSTLPLKRVHGDYWPGNILVGPDRRITVIDTFGYGATPRYEDIAYFLIHLRTTKPQMYSLGLWNREADVNDWESAFLEGYFDKEPVPIETVSLFGLLALLYRWAHGESVTRDLTGTRGQLKKLQQTWRRRFLRKLVLSRLDALERLDTNRKEKQP